MPDLRLERTLDVSPEDLWALVSTPEGLLQWWGPEGMTVPEYALDFSRTGPWFSVMVGGEGQRHKVSGHVTKVVPRESVAFTWAWHDDADVRGAESHVTLSVMALGAGKARLVLDHRDLPDTASAERHTQGWTSSLRKLERRKAA